MSTPTIEYRTIDKSAWGPGEWQDEPDKRQWEDPETGLPCLIVRGPSGALCGYVGVSPEHPAHGLNYDHWRWSEDGEAAPLTPVEEVINALKAHGGLTFADSCAHGDDPSQGICHIPGEGEPDTVWWFGFDCAHYGDLSPRSEYGSLSRSGLYRDFAYVATEVTDLARQLRAIAPDRSEAVGEGKLRDEQTSKAEQAQ